MGNLQGTTRPTSASTMLFQYSRMNVETHFVGILSLLIFEVPQNSMLKRNSTQHLQSLMQNRKAKPISTHITSKKVSASTRQQKLITICLVLVFVSRPIHSILIYTVLIRSATICSISQHFQVFAVESFQLSSLHAQTHTHGSPHPVMSLLGLFWKEINPSLFMYNSRTSHSKLHRPQGCLFEQISILQQEIDGQQITLHKIVATKISPFPSAK